MPSLRERPTVEEMGVVMTEAVEPIIAEYGYTRINLAGPFGDGAAYEVAGHYEGGCFILRYAKVISVSFSSGCDLPERLVTK